MSAIRTIISLLSIIIPFAAISAQDVDDDAVDTTLVSPQQYDSIIDYLPESINDDISKLLDGWHVRHFSKAEDFCIDDETDPYFPDSVYKMRMKKMPFVVPMTYNATVRKCIDLYSGRRRSTIRYIMGMAYYFFPMIEQKLDANGLPDELKYLAVVESALNPVVQSHKGACGIWQFMLPTGKVYGLEINSLVDERYDPERATEAACKYFKEMYDLFDDWLLAIAAYNCGPGNVDKAIRRAGGKMDFWAIFPYLPKETRSYVPLFMAAAYVMTYHCDHNICPVRTDFSVTTDTIVVNRALHFDQIADILKMDKEAIRFYNPQYKREIVPGNIQPSILRLPLDKTRDFFENEASLYEHRLEELLANCTPVDPGNPENRKEKITHKVKSGETVYTIANLYGVTAQNLRRWNSLSGSRVAAGRNLRVYIDNGGLAYSAPKKTAAPTQQAATQNASAKNASTTQNVSATSASATSKPPQIADGKQKYVSYEVKQGETLYSIAKQYPGVSPQNIQDANGLATSKLRIGQILKIPQG
ncbi:MAG: LysM peptidoglycan-binding domain-containing protein [Tannerella sp.]|jgi:membrane-bound lytic murein transglycosylase D|nr:LysM peptidoglycan-binding domain-containing protein [Tannerella sp.]